MIKSALRAALALSLFAVAAAAPASSDQRSGRGGAVLYKDPGFRGAAISINGPVANLALARFNDTISSIEIYGAWEICVDPDFRGKCTIIDGSVARLSDLRMNDNITSLRPLAYQNRRSRNGRHGGGFAQNHYGAPVTLFRDPGFRGAAIDLSEPIANLKQIGFNDTASSIQIGYGDWLVCEDPGFRGRCLTISGSVDRLTDIGMNDRISSLRPIKGRHGRGRDWR